MLGLAHSLHADIIAHGKGRFSHWGTSVYFSASDNTDPNQNGRTYRFCEKF
jgi:pectate lyase